MPIGKDELNKLIDVISKGMNERLDREVAAMRQDLRHEASRIVDTLLGDELRRRLRVRLEEDINIDVTLRKGKE